jgi:peptidylprolyl isomerase
MQQAKRGDRVKVHYTGTLEDGTVFDSSSGEDPLEFTIGDGQVIPGVEEAIVGMSAGQQKHETIEPGRGYGDRNEELVFSVSRDQLPPGSDIEIGDMLQVGFGDGRTSTVQVMQLSDDLLTLDANHPLAGKTLLFDLELVSIG